MLWIESITILIVVEIGVGYFYCSVLENDYVFGWNEDRLETLYFLVWAINCLLLYLPEGAETTVEDVAEVLEFEKLGVLDWVDRFA